MRKKFFPTNSSRVNNVANKTANTKVMIVINTTYKIVFCIASIKRMSLKRTWKLKNPAKVASLTKLLFLKNAVLNTSIVGITIKMKTRITAGARHANTNRFCAFFLFMSYLQFLKKRRATICSSLYVLLFSYGFIF